MAFPSQAHELGTPLSASFEGFGPDESGRVSARQLQLALKEIGQFRWTTVGVWELSSPAEDQLGIKLWGGICLALSPSPHDTSTYRLLKECFFTPTRYQRMFFLEVTLK